MYQTPSSPILVIFGGGEKSHLMTKVFENKPRRRSLEFKNGIEEEVSGILVEK